MRQVDQQPGVRRVPQSALVNRVEYEIGESFFNFGHRVQAVVQVVDIRFDVPLGERAYVRPENFQQSGVKRDDVVHIFTQRGNVYKKYVQTSVVIFVTHSISFCQFPTLSYNVLRV